MGCWHENLYPHATESFYFYFGERNTFNNVSDNSEEQKQEKSIAIIEGFHAKKSKFSDPCHQRNFIYAEFKYIFVLSAFSYL
jgi:hypothetical protein